MYFNFIAFLELKRFDHSSRKADSKTVSPFSNLHATLFIGYTLSYMYIHEGSGQGSSDAAIGRASDQGSPTLGRNGLGTRAGHAALAH
jgi:hypothetical protein